MLAVAVAAALSVSAPAAERPAQIAAFEKRLRSDLLRHLKGSRRNPVARELAEFLAGRPELSLRVSTEVPRSLAALWDASEGVIEVSTRLVAGAYSGASSGGEPLIERMAPVLVHELVHAQASAALPGLPTVFEDELLAYAMEAWYLEEESPGWLAPVAAAPGPWSGPEAESAHDAALSRLRKARRELKKARARGPPHRVVAARLELARALEGWLEVSSHLKDLPKLDDVSVTLASLWNANRKGWPAFESRAKGLAGRRPSIYSEDDVRSQADEARMERAELETDLKKLAAAGASKEDLERVLEAWKPILESRSFWTDPVRLSEARLYFESRLAQARAHSGRNARTK